MRRREFITLLGGAAAAWPVAARGQQPKKQHRIAFVHSGIPADQLTETAGPFWVRRFYETLRGLGDAEGGNLVVDRYSAEGRSERFASLAAAVVNRNPDGHRCKPQRSHQSVHGGDRHDTARRDHGGSDPREDWS